MPKFIHVMIRVRDLQQSADFYRDVFGFQEIHRLDFPSFTLVYLRNADTPFEIELTLNKDQSEPYDHGNAYGHIAFAVDQLSDMHQRLIGQGYQPTPIKQLKHGDQALATFFFISDPDGYKIEVLQSGGHYQ
ncbi:MAG: VOC family protein [Castellaniella sp.]|nr:VOC family protein [Castellaniella sp.]